jgi:acetyl esterase/lipase
MMRFSFVAALATMFAVATANAAPISFSDLLARDRAAPTKVIAYGTAPHQYAELWLPNGAGPHRTLVVIHGGCWRSDLPGPELMAYMSEDLRKHGYAVWSIDYRRIGDDGGGYPGTFLDTALAIDKLRNIAPTFKLDLRKLVTIGHSAGGHLATWSAARRNLPKTSPLRKDSPLPLTGVVSLAGISDLKDYRERGPDACGGPATIDALIGAKTRPGVDPYSDTSPVELLPIGARQVIVAGAQDKIVPLPLVHSYGNKASAIGDVEIGLPFAGHFELIDPASKEWPEIRAEIDRLMQ